MASPGLSSSPRHTPRLGQRNEGLVLVPAALVVLTLVSTVTLFSYRGTVHLLLDERQAEAQRAARRVALALTGPRVPVASELQALAPHAAAVVLLDPAGRAAARVGDPDVASGSVLGTARVQPVASGYEVQVQLAAPILGNRMRSLRILALVVVGTNLSVLLLVLLFMRRLMAPLDHMIERVRELRPDRHSEPGDEVQLLVETFERALVAYSETDTAAGSRPGDDLEALGRTFVRSLESGVLLLARDGTVQALNRRGADLLAVEVPPTGSSIHQAFAGHRELVTALEEVVAEGRRVRRREISLAEVAGGARTVGLTVHPLRHEDGEVRGYLALFADLTADREARRQEQLRQGLEQLGELAAGVAHEMRNSLATLKGYLDLCQREKDGAAQREYLAEVEAESGRLLRVVEDFLSFARPGSAHAERVDLHELALRAARDPGLGGQEVRVETLPSDEAADFHVIGDSHLLERALVNLTRNGADAHREALRASGTRDEEEAPCLNLRLQADQDRVEIVVEDRGPGLPQGAVERLFLPFVSERADGVGLGLALTRRIVHLHGGEVSLETRDGGGARARIRLPRGELRDGNIVTEGSSALDMET